MLAAGLLVIAQLVDVALLSRWSWPGATPDLTLLVVVALALLGGPASGAVAGLSAGLLADLTPPGAVTARADRRRLRAGRRGGRALAPPRRAVAAAADDRRCGCRGHGVVACSSVVLLVTGRQSLRLGAARDPGRRALRAVGALVVVPLVVLLDRLVEGEPAEAVRL